MQERANGLVTPEAVLLQFETAGVGSRCIATVVDSAIRGVALLLVILATGILSDVAGGLPTWAPVTVLTFAGFFVIFGYSAFLETIWRGRTPGKALLGLRVVTVEGAPIRFRHALIRATVGLVEIQALAGALAGVMIFITQRNQRLGDLAAGTVVLRERSAEAPPVPVTFTVPSEAESFVRTVDVATLTTDEYVTVRSFLLRAPNMVPNARAGLADQLARQIGSRVRAMPPHWMTAEQFLVCVITAYQRRNVGR